MALSSVSQTHRQTDDGRAYGRGRGRTAYTGRGCWYVRVPLRSGPSWLTRRTCIHARTRGVEDGQECQLVDGPLGLDSSGQCLGPGS